jgi:RNA polymerase sigma-70 factor, ECF subfamily
MQVMNLSLPFPSGLPGAWSRLLAWMSQALSPVVPVSSIKAEKDYFVKATIDEHYRGVYQYALSLCRNEDDACDLTQQTIATFVEKVHQLRDTSRVKGWLYTTVYRGFLKVRSGRNREEPLDEETPSHVPELEARQAVDLDGQLVMAGLQRLATPYRAVLTLFYLEDLSYKEIAACLDLPIGTVMSRLNRAKELLRAELIA